ncbi:MAG: alpha/beta hydrolase [Cellvibrionaceae bacterium]|nr:alpha/beta hydrolase [Cellvibrionaceae bacterium]
MPITRLFFVCFVFLCVPFAYGAAPIKTHSDIVWAQPEGFTLTLDIHVPEAGRDQYPVLIIYHGGGWLLNTKSIMDDMARYMASHGKYVVVNANYRLLADQNNTVTVNEIIEDAMGALLWVKDHIAQYKGDPNKIAITGDSAGGHLAGMVMLGGRMLESDGYAGESLGFNPSYLPRGMTAEKIAANDGLKVQAVILSYTAFDLAAIAQNNFETEQNPFWGWANAKPRGVFGDAVSFATRPDFYRAASPINHIPQSRDYKLPPQFVHVGSEDGMTTPELAKDYVKRIKKAGHSATLKIYKKRGHGFLDSGCNDYTNGCFTDLAVPTLKDMIRFLDKVFARK